jgi:hypothetical protein
VSAWYSVYSNTILNLMQVGPFSIWIHIHSFRVLWSGCCYIIAIDDSWCILYIFYLSFPFCNHQYAQHTLLCRSTLILLRQPGLPWQSDNIKSATALPAHHQPEHRSRRYKLPKQRVYHCHEYNSKILQCSASGIRPRLILQSQHRPIRKRH